MNYAVILAGGSGSRFWPLSRKHLPKQFLGVVEKESLLKSTVRRIREIVVDKNIFLVTQKRYLKEIKKQLSGFKIPRENIILEPTPKNTLPAILLCTQILSLKDKQAKIMVFPSDHYIKGSTAFKKAMRGVLQLAEKGFICLVGIKPDKPRSGYGYITIGKSMAKDKFYVRRFKEKPLASRAKQLYWKKNIFWNAGIFCFKAETIFKEVRRYLPNLYRQISKIRNKSKIQPIWKKIQSVSFDYGVLEKSRNLAMLLAKFSWHDLGSWDALFDVLSQDAKKNTVLSDCGSVSLDTQDTLVCSYTHKRLIACLGLKNLIIVDTPDALLVCKKEKTQDIKKLVGLLAKKRKTYV